jgi:DNA-binding HxlR family transcriptional regulator
MESLLVLSSGYCFYTKYAFVSIQDLIALFHHRWSAPVLAELLRQKGSRFVTLGNTLGVGRESLKRTLGSLIDLGLVARNPGYGHPLRPEYVLTPRGHRVAGRCAKLLEALNGGAEMALRKWSLPVLVALRRPSRFSELQAALPGVTARALALALKDLQAAGLVERRIADASPPTAV